MLRPFFHTLRFCLAALLTTGLSSPEANAQAGRQEYSIHAMDSVVRTAGGELIGLTLQLENRTQSSVNIRLTYTLPAGIALLGNRKDEIWSIDPLSKRFLPVKFRVDPKSPAGNARIGIRLENADSLVLATTSIGVAIQEKRSIQLQALSTSELMRHVGDSVKSSLLLRNAGNTDETIQLLSSIPTSFGSRKFTRHQLFLPAGSDTIYTLSYLADRELFGMEQVQINITGLYEDQVVFGNTAVVVQNATSDRTFSQHPANGFHWNQQTNRIVLTSRNPFTDQQSLYLDANLQTEIGKGNLELNSNLYQWGQLSTPPVLTNTWLHYTRDKLGLTIGNITQSMEKMVNGRGFMADYTDTLNNRIVLFGITDKSYDLLDYYGIMERYPGFSIFGQFQSGGLSSISKKQSTAAFLFDRDPIENSESIVLSGSVQLLTPTKFRRNYLRIDLGAGASRALEDPLHQHSTEPSLSVGSTFNTEFKKLYLTSNNYYSTAYYPGNRRGTVNLSQRLGIRIRNNNLWIGQSFFQHQPKTFFLDDPGYFLLTDRIDIGASFQLSPFMTFSLIPNRFHEKNRYNISFNGSSTPDLESVAYRMETSLNWRSKNNKHFMHLMAEGGIQETYPSTRKPIQYRTNLLYNFWKFNMSVNYQEGAFSLVELINNDPTNRQDIYRLGGTFNFYHHSRKDFRTSFGLQFYKDSYSGKNESANARFEYGISEKTAIFTQIYAYRYSRPLLGQFNAVNFQMGITQSFARAKGATVRSKQGKLTVFSYYDHNNNERFDTGDAIAMGKSILIDGKLFLSDQEGHITYNKVPYGTYPIDIPLENGWHAPQKQVTLDNKSTHIEIALRKSGTLRGKVMFDFDPQFSMDVNTGLEGYRIIATGENGYQAVARTDTGGAYLLFLPEGNYEVSINENDFPEHVLVAANPLKIEIKAGKINEIPAFELNIRNKKVEIKRFRAQ